MNTVSSFAELPTSPAVFALYGGAGASLYVAYAASALSLRARVTQLLVKRNQDLTSGKTAVSLNPDQVTELRWWEHPQFAKREALEAATLVALETLDPALRSPMTLSQGARRVHYRPKFRKDMATLVGGPATGAWRIPSLSEALAAITALEQRVAALEQRSR